MSEEFDNAYEEDYDDWCERVDNAFLKSLERNGEIEHDYELETAQSD